MLICLICVVGMSLRMLFSMFRLVCRMGIIVKVVLVTGNLLCLSGVLMLMSWVGMLWVILKVMSMDSFFSSLWKRCGGVLICCMVVSFCVMSGCLMMVIMGILILLFGG